MFELGARPDLCSVTCPNPAATSLSRRYASSDGAYANLKAKEVSPIWGRLALLRIMKFPVSHRRKGEWALINKQKIKALNELRRSVTRPHSTAMSNAQ